MTDVNAQLWTALRMIRHAIEELGPVGCLASEEYCAVTPGPHGHAIREAEELIGGIQKMAGQ